MGRATIDPTDMMASDHEISMYDPQGLMFKGLGTTDKILDSEITENSRAR